MVLGSVGKGDLTMHATLHQAGLLTVILRSQIPNNSQWCRDWSGDYPGGRVTDPSGPASGSNRVLRGGGWSNVAAVARSAYRRKNSPGFRNVGFRFALSAVR